MTRCPIKRKREIIPALRWLQGRGGAVRFCAGVGVLALVGCATPLSQEEVQLHSVSSEAVVSVTVASGKGQPVALRVSVSEHLEQPELVVRDARGIAVHSPENQWAEPLADDIDRLLRTRLAAAPEVSRVLSPGLESDVSAVLLVTLRVDRFEGERQAGGLSRAIVDATWRISRPGARSGPSLSSGLFVREADGWDGEDFEVLRELLEQLAADLADTVTESLARALGNPVAPSGYSVPLDAGSRRSP